MKGCVGGCFQQVAYLRAVRTENRGQPVPKNGKKLGQRQSTGNLRHVLSDDLSRSCAEGFVLGKGADGPSP